MTLPERHQCSPSVLRVAPGAKDKKIKKNKSQKFEDAKVKGR